LEKQKGIEGAERRSILAASDTWLRQQQQALAQLDQKRLQLREELAALAEKTPLTPKQLRFLDGQKDQRLAELKELATGRERLLRGALKPSVAVVAGNAPLEQKLEQLSSSRPRPGARLIGARTLSPRRLTRQAMSHPLREKSASRT
jgi:hypothetical protein